MTCKDCIHYHVCKHADDTEHLSMGAICTPFKNKADFTRGCRVMAVLLCLSLGMLIAFILIMILEGV